MGLGPKKVVIAKETLLIIAETAALKIPKSFKVFLWLLHHWNLGTYWASQTILMVLQIWVQFSTYVTRQNFSWAHKNPIKFWNFAIVEVFASCL